MELWSYGSHGFMSFRVCARWTQGKLRVIAECDSKPLGPGAEIPADLEPAQRPSDSTYRTTKTSP